MFLSTSDISQLYLVAEKNAWRYDPSTQILSPKMRSNAPDQIGPSSSEFGTRYSLPRLFIWPKASLPSIFLQIACQDWSSEIAGFRRKRQYNRNIIINKSHCSFCYTSLENATVNWSGSSEQYSEGMGHKMVLVSVVKRGRWANRFTLS